MTLAGTSSTSRSPPSCWARPLRRLHALVNERLGIEMITLQIAHRDRPKGGHAAVASGRWSTWRTTPASRPTCSSACAPQLEAAAPGTRPVAALRGHGNAARCPCSTAWRSWASPSTSACCASSRGRCRATSRRPKREIYAIVGHEFNIGSPKQLSDILFKRTRAAEDAQDHPGLQHRPARARRPAPGGADHRPDLRVPGTDEAEVDLHSTRCPGTVAADGRIHTDFQQTVAATGRLSSTNPNLQNIPVRTDTRPRHPSRVRRRRLRRTRGSSRPTTRRSSCACSPTSPGTTG